VSLREDIARIFAPNAEEIEGWHNTGIGRYSNLWSYALKRADEVLALVDASGVYSKKEEDASWLSWLGLS
jgi:hypothetical protein